MPSQRVRYEKEACSQGSVRLLLVEVLHGGEVSKNEEFKGVIFFSPRPADHEVNSMPPLTNVDPTVILEGEDYGLKGRIDVSAIRRAMARSR